MPKNKVFGQAVGGGQNRLAISMTWLLCNLRIPLDFMNFLIIH